MTPMQASRFQRAETEARNAFEAFVETMRRLAEGKAWGIEVERARRAFVGATGELDATAHRIEEQMPQAASRLRAIPGAQAGAKIRALARGGRS